MESNEFSPERKLEVFADIQYRILKSGYSLENHLNTIEELPKKNRLRHYERLFESGWITEKQYNKFTKETYSVPINFSKN
jgi:hypothetical protein